MNMARTTITISDNILNQIRDLSVKEHHTIAKTLTELVTVGLHQKRLAETSVKNKPFKVVPFSMGKPKVNLEDKDALYRVLDAK
jgi:hypothetical protein